jgi:crossover junction endodeoxyribonuclease RusA
VKITLGWPDQHLWPNRKAHWARARMWRNEQKIAAWALTLAEKRVDLGEGRIPVTLTFHKNDRRRFDLDNALAAMKGALDGLSAALGVDDSRFDVRPVLGEPVAGGCVVVEVDQVLAAVGVVLG